MRVPVHHIAGERADQLGEEQRERAIHVGPVDGIERVERRRFTIEILAHAARPRDVDCHHRHVALVGVKIVVIAPADAREPERRRDRQDNDQDRAMRKRQPTDPEPAGVPSQAWARARGDFTWMDCSHTLLRHTHP